MERIDLVPRASPEAEVEVRGRRRPSHDVDVREARLAFAVRQLLDLERCENRLVESDALRVL
jgi:hypothetical protein